MKVAKTLPHRDTSDTPSHEQNTAWELHDANQNTTSVFWSRYRRLWAHRGRSDQGRRGPTRPHTTPPDRSYTIGSGRVHKGLTRTIAAPLLGAFAAAWTVALWVVAAGANAGGRPRGSWVHVLVRYCPVCDRETLERRVVAGIPKPTQATRLEVIAPHLVCPERPADTAVGS